MTDQSIIVGRDDILDAVRACVHWNPAQALPIVILTGPEGSGKSTLLRTVRAMTASLPGARLDLADELMENTAQVTTAMVLQLSYRHRGLKRLTFPRFLAGRLAVQVELRGRSPQEDHQTMRKLVDTLQARRVPADVRKLAARLGDVVAPSLGLPSVPGASELAVEAVDAAFVRLRRPAGLGWWARGSGLDPVDKLIELRRMTRGNPDERRSAEEELTQAFLTDLREAYEGSVFTSPIDQAAVVVLENAHTEVAQRALEVLADVRDRMPADPLLVIAAGGRRTGAAAAPADDRLNLAAWRAGVLRGHPETRFWPIALRPLSPAEVRDWGRRIGHRNRSLVAAVYRLTGGHPAGVAELFGAEPFGDFRAALTRADDMGRHRFEVLLAGMLPEADIPDLASGAAARRTRTTDLQAALPEDPADRAAELLRLLEARWWLLPENGLHPWLRQLLLLSLRARPADDKQSWRKVHDRLHEHYLAGDPTEAACHWLAAGEWAEVIKKLHSGLATADPAWFDVLRQIAEAPHRDADDVGVLQTAVEAVGDEDLVKVALTRLLAAMWLVADPLNATADEAGTLAQRYCQELAWRVPRSADEFYALAAEYVRTEAP